jgi:hypothetical protein
MPGTNEPVPLELGFAVAPESMDVETGWSDRIGGCPSIIDQGTCGICHKPLLLLAQLATFVGSSDRLLEILVCSSILPSDTQRTSCSSQSQGYE